MDDMVLCKVLRTRRNVSKLVEGIDTLCSHLQQTSQHRRNVSKLVEGIDTNHPNLCSNNFDSVEMGVSSLRALTHTTTFFLP